MGAMNSEAARPGMVHLAPLAILAASVGALGFAYVAEVAYGIEPCELCLWQRVPYAVAGLLAVAALLAPSRRWRVSALAACGAAFAAGMGIALYHVGVEQHWWASAACAAGSDKVPATVEALRAMLTAPPPKPCDALDWTLFGVSMATYNVAASAALAAGAFWAAEKIRKAL
jgi:disulfide bond formation protein DsbB